MQAEKKSPAIKKIMIALCTAAAALAAIVCLRFVTFDNDISVMLPREKEVTQAFRFFREAPFASNVFVSFELKEGADAIQDLTAAVDAFTASVKSPLIARIVSGADAAQSFESLREFVRLAPQLMDEQRLREMDSMLKPAHVREKLNGLYRMSLNPAGSVMLPLLQQDPLGLHEKALQDLRMLAEGSDYDVRLEEGHLISRDGRHAMVVLETKVPVTDGSRSRELLEHLDRVLARLPANISADIIAGHRHSVSNEITIKRDILVTTSVTAVVFLFLFFFVFRDVRALLLFFTPSLSVLISIPLCALILGKLSYIIMGMGAVISGIAVDYCIHVYIAMQSGQVRKDAVREIAKPVISGALTTAGAFAVFLFSDVPGYQQLALFTVISTFFSLALALLIFPYFLSSSTRGIGYKQKDFLRHFPASFDRAVIFIWLAVLAGCAAAVPSVHFKMDIKQYDGSEKAIFEAEQKFHKVWGGRAKPAILAAEAKTFDEALETAAKIEQGLKDIPWSSLSSVWPAETQRKANLTGWNEYWNGERKEDLRRILKKESAAFDFSESAFDPFLNGLSLDMGEVKNFENIGLLEQVKRRFAFETPRGQQVVSYFPDEPASVTAAAQAASHFPGAFVISAKKFETLLSAATLKEAVWLSLAIAVILPVLAFFFLKNVRLVLISLVPVASSILCILGMLAVFNLNLNVASLIALMVVGGFSIDYGTFMIHQNEHDLKTNTYLGVTLSALTAFCGAGALVFAKHPVLFSYGTAMISGVTGGYLSAVFVVPAIYRLGRKTRQIVPLERAA